MIILDRKVLRDAPLQDLEETYKAVTGLGLDATLCLAAARTKVDMALMTSADAVGHLGIPRDTTPQPMTIEQLRSMGIKMNKEKEVEQEIARFVPGSMADQLWKASQAMPKIEPRKPRTEPGERRAKIASVKATGNGESKPQAGSLRSNVLKYIQDQPDGIADVDAMEAALGYPVRGHVQKLIEKKHLTVESVVEATPAPAAAEGAAA